MCLLQKGSEIPAPTPSLLRIASHRITQQCHRAPPKPLTPLLLFLVLFSLMLLLSMLLLRQHQRQCSMKSTKLRSDPRCMYSLVTV